MSNLSSATQAVMDAFNGFHDLANRRLKIAAALRAAADQVEQKWRGFAHEACQEIRAIAAELEGQP